MALGSFDEGQRSHEELLQGNRRHNFRTGHPVPRSRRLAQHRFLPASRENVSACSSSLAGGEPVGAALTRWPSAFRKSYF